ncbi:MAG: tetratricopeptide repeat protein [Vulcanimicrobiota bacterium]
MEGAAEFVSNGTAKKSPLCLLTELSEGDTVIMKGKSNARIVFYADTHSVTLNGPCLVKILSGSCILQEGAPGSIISKEPYRGIKALNSIKASSDKFGGVTTRSSGITIISPKGKIATLKPLFQWANVAGVTQYAVTIIDDKRKVITTLQAGSNSVRYSDLEPELNFGSCYYWKVNARLSSGLVEEGNAAFIVIPRETWDTLKTLNEQAEEQLRETPNDKSPYSVLLAFYMENFLFDEALDTCRKLLSKDSDNRNVHYWMGRIYESKGMDKEAKEEYLKAGTQNP